MQLENHTTYPAALFRMAIDDRRFVSSVVARVTFDVTASGLSPCAEQPWTVSAEPWENEFGQMDSDAVVCRSGADIFLFGQAYAPRGEATELELTIEVGNFTRRILVFGDRIWQRCNGMLIPGPPQPFHVIPLSLAYAFGGKDSWDGLQVSHPDNPQGRGFYLEEKNAEGQLLPNLENPAQRIRHWNDRHDPVGTVMCPLASSLRLRRGVTLDEQQQLAGIKPGLFNAAFPEMIAEKLSPGDGVRLSGVLRDEVFSFQLPHFALTTRLQFDDEVIDRPLVIDQLGIEPDRRRIFVTYRYHFRYVMHPLQKRSCLLFTAAGEPRTEGR